MVGPFNFEVSILNLGIVDGNLGKKSLSIDQNFQQYWPCLHVGLWKSPQRS